MRSLLINCRRTSDKNHSSFDGHTLLLCSSQSPASSGFVMWKFATQLVRQAEGIIAPEEAHKGPTHGFRVLHVDHDSEAIGAGIESLFDFIVGVNGTVLGHKTLPDGSIDVQTKEAPVDEVLNLSPGTTVSFNVWSAKGKVVRQVDLSVDEQGLGLTLQWTPLSVSDHVWHILNVLPGSPAEEAGLISHADYIVGAEEGLLEQGGEGLLARVTTRVASDPSKDGSVTFYVYNHDYDTLRPVRIVPRADPQGQRLLGCGVGYGLLHKLPVVEKRQRLPPGSLLFEDAAQAEPEPVVSPSGPAAVVPLPPSVNSTSATTHRANKVHHKAADLSAYFDEQTQMSQAVDGTPRSTDTEIPLPPKA